MKLDKLSIADVFCLTPRRFEDQRGYFRETYNQISFEAATGLNDHFIQDNHAYSALKGTIRGLHFQTPPMAQAKLVHVMRGAIWDVVVDLRRSSESYGKWVGVELSQENGKQLYVPEGFAHGYITLMDDCDVIYKVNQFYAPDHEAGLKWNDPMLAISWPDVGISPALSNKDQELTSFSDFKSCFT